MITIAQCRAARGLLDWTQQDLAEASGLSKTAINNFEKGHSDIKNESLRAIRMAFEGADIEFLEDGLRKRNETTRILKGAEALNMLFSDIFDTMQGGGEILMAWIDESLNTRIPAGQFVEHLARMKNMNINLRILGREDSLPAILKSSATCRYLESGTSKPGMMTIIYGTKVALELWNHSMIVILDSAEAAQAEKLRFEQLWGTARTSALKSHSAGT